MNRAPAISLMLSISGFVLPSWAEPSQEDAAAAQVLFDEAKRMLDQGQAAAACPKLEESLRLDVGIGTRYHLARCYELTGRIASAWSQYLEVAAASHAARQLEREAAAREKAESLEPRLSRLTLAVPELARVPGLRVQRNGVDIGSAQWDLPVPVDIGLYTISAAAPGRESWQTEVAVRDDGTSETVSVPLLTPVEAPPPAAPVAVPVRESPPVPPPVTKPRPQEQTRPNVNGWQWAGIAMAGVGAVSLGASGVFALVAADKDRASGCDAGICPSRDAEPLNRSALRYGDLATATLVVGSTLVAGGLAVFLAGSEREPQAGSHTAVSVSLGSFGVGVRVDRSFW
jgi:hypothetical protein